MVGHSIPPAGDFDADLDRDFLIGAPGVDTGGTLSGAVYAILGAGL